MKKHPSKVILLIIGYSLLALFAVLLTMGGESLIGSVHPWADMLDSAIMWLGLLAALSAVVCLPASLLCRRPVLSRVLLLIPLLLLAAECMLIAIAGYL